MIKNQTKYGTIIITEEFLTKLAGYAAVNSFGVVGMADKSPVEALYSLVKSDRLSRGIKIHFDGKFVDVDLHIVVAYGTNITSVVNSIAHKVRYVFDDVCKIKVRDVNTFVDGMKV